MGKKKKKEFDSNLARNRKAFHDYHIYDKVEAGLELRGTEVKSCRIGNVNLLDSYVKIENGEAFLHNVHIAQYPHGNRYNHEPTRVRRLLLHKREILKLSQQIKEKGNTLIPLRFYLNRGKVKVEIAVARGKKDYDKRDKMREKQHAAEARNAMRR